MKRIILVVAVGLLISAPAVVFAMKGANPIYDLTGQPEDSVAVFDDGDNKCYVVKGRATEFRGFAGYGYSISCLSGQ